MQETASGLGGDPIVTIGLVDKADVEIAQQPDATAEHLASQKLDEQAAMDAAPGVAQQPNLPVGPLATEQAAWDQVPGATEQY